MKVVFDKFTTKLFKKVSIFCVVLTGRDYKYARDIPMKNTWLSQCNKYIFANSINDPSLPSLKMASKHGYEHSYEKIRGIFRYIYKKYGTKYDWFYKVDNDSYGMLNNLRMFLLRKNPTYSKGFYGFRVRFGHRKIQGGYHVGGAGYVLSKASLKKLVTKGFPNTQICRQIQPGLEDEEIGECMVKLSIKTHLSSDYLGRHLFIPGNASEFATPNKNVHKSIFKRVAQGGTFGDGITSLGDYPIVYHYTDAKNMFAMHYLMYKAHVAGLSSRIHNCVALAALLAASAHACFDTIDDCDLWVSLCTTNEYVANNCGDTCKNCGGFKPPTTAAPCFDVGDHCADLNICGDPQYFNIAYKDCRKTCNLCDATNPFQETTVVPTYPWYDDHTQAPCYDDIGESNCDNFYSYCRDSCMF
uniref:N-acetylgalactosaminide beta-1,3-galactosyltransferase n=1 Tax=Rhabditophanes sp. KR3021 TaxID=114890 RepID=A0AC35THR9_9BILA